MRLATAALLLSACGAALHAPASAPPEGGYVDGVCQPTTRTDISGVITTTGVFGLLAPIQINEAEAMNSEITVVWRKTDASSPLMIRGYPLDPENQQRATWVEWGVGGPIDRQTPWGKAAYVTGLKPIGSAGCWRIAPYGGPLEDGIVIVIRPS
jgi:hypothetical protein